MEISEIMEACDNQACSKAFDEFFAACCESSPLFVPEDFSRADFNAGFNACLSAIMRKANRL
jgi:hypothetical protein